jgi:hypothetical protein
VFQGALCFLHWVPAGDPDFTIDTEAGAEPN